MGQSIEKIILIALLLSAIAAPVSAIDYFSYQMNFPSGEQRGHYQTINYTGINLTVTIPDNFTIVNYSSDGNLYGLNITWGNGTNKQVNYTIRSPSNCAEGDFFFSNIFLNSAFVSRFVFVCIPDNKIMDYKMEYGHGSANYLTEYYISNETATLFNLIRVFNIGHYLDSDEDALNAVVNCTFERYPVRTYGRVAVDYLNNSIKGSFLWDIIESGYWFRIGVLSQDVSGKSLGDFYNITCGELAYDFTHERVRAAFANKSIEVRSSQPFQINASQAADKLVYAIKNTEKYTVYDLNFRWQVENYTRTSKINRLSPNETVKYEVFLDGAGNISLGVDFIPSWYANSLKPRFYSQLQTDSFSINASKSPQIISVEPIVLEILRRPTTVVSGGTTNIYGGGGGSYYYYYNYTTLLPVEKLLANGTILINQTINIGITQERDMGKLDIVSFPEKIDILLNETLEKTIRVKNIGAGVMHNLTLQISGLPADSYTIKPDVYATILPEEEKAFSIIFKSGIEEKDYKIKFLVLSEEGNREVDSILSIQKATGKEEVSGTRPAGQFIALAEGEIYQFMLYGLLILTALLLGYLYYHFHGGLARLFEHTSSIKKVIDEENIGRHVKLAVNATPILEKDGLYTLKLKDGTGKIYSSYAKPLKGKFMIDAVVGLDKNKAKCLEIRRYQPVNAQHKGEGMNKMANTMPQQNNKERKNNSKRIGKIQ